MNLSRVSRVPQYAHADFARWVFSEPSKLTRDTRDTRDTRGNGPLSFPVLGIATNTQDNPRHYGGQRFFTPQLSPSCQPPVGVEWRRS